MTAGEGDQEPDYRFTLANERTFLAWIRTSLGLLAGAVAVVQFAPDLGPRWTRDALGVVLAVLAASSALGGLLRWRAVERSMRAGGPLEQGLLPFVLAAGLTGAALGALAVVLLEAAR